MHTHTEKTPENKSSTIADNLANQKNRDEAGFQFADNRPEAIAQRKLCEAMNNSPRVQQLNTYQAMADKFTSKRAQRTENREEETVQGKFESAPEKKNKTGLPSNLKTGIENLSGYSMDNVKVHYNSAEPAQLQAHAFARGTDIHLSAGQERHLPHEAWHVVQQKQGRVKPTLQMKGGIDINDDEALEKEADAMGEKVTQMKAGELLEGSAPRGIVQRVNTHKSNVNDVYKDRFEEVLSDLDTAVQKAYMFVIHYPTLGQYSSLDGHTERWVETWSGYIANKPTGLLHADFGYAVESLATMIYLSSPPGGLKIELQGIRNGTRPDLVLKDNDQDVAWLDITSSGSPLHIFGKAGWSQKTHHLGEVVYPALDPRLILDNVQKGRKYNDQTDADEVMGRVRYFKWIHSVRRRHWATTGQQLFNQPLDSRNQAEKRYYIRRRVANYLGVDFSELPPIMLGSVLYAMNIGTQKHGYNKKNEIKGISRARGESFLQEHDPALPAVESFSPAIMRNPQMLEAIESAQQEQAINVTDDYLPGQNDFDPEGQEPSADNALSVREIAVVGRKQPTGRIEPLEIVSRMTPYLNRNFSLDPGRLKTLLDSLIFKNDLFKGLKAVKTFGIKVRLENGSTGVVRLDNITAAGFRLKYIRLQETQKTQREKRQELFDKSRKQITSSEDQAKSLSLATTNNFQTMGFGAFQLPQNIQGQILGFAYEMEDGTRVAVGEDNQVMAQIEDQ